MADTNYALTIKYNGKIYYIGGGGSATLPIATDTTLGAIKVGLNLSINEDGTLNATDTTYEDATQNTAGLMSASDKTKLDNLPSNAQVNQNAFSKVIAGSDAIVSDTETDTLNVEGSNITITGSPASKKITFALSKQGIINALGYTPVETDTNTSHYHGVGAGLLGSGEDGVSGGTFTYKLALQSETKDVNNALVRPASNANRIYPVVLDASGVLSAIVPWTDTLYSLPVATSTTLGGVKIGYTTSGKNYAVQVNENNQMYVNVPWSDTSYELPTMSTSVKGGAKVGSGLTIDSDTLNVDTTTIATKESVDTKANQTDLDTFINTTAPDTYVAKENFKTNYLDANGVAYTTNLGSYYNKTEVDSKLKNYVDLTSSQTITGAKTFNGNNTFNGESQFIHSGYAPTWVDIANGIGKSSCFTRGSFMQLFTGQILLANANYSYSSRGYNTEANKLKIQSYTVRGGQPASPTDIAVFSTTGLNVNGTLTANSKEVALKEDITATNIVSTLGTTPVNRATADASGNNIEDNYALKTEIPNVDNFITKDVNNLTNYYTIESIDSLVTTLKKNRIQVVADKPTTGEEGITYLVGSTAPYGMWVYEESYGWIYLGSSSIDLDGYVTGQDLTSNMIILGSGGTGVKTSNISIVTSLGNDNSSVPTSLAVKSVIESNVSELQADIDTKQASTDNSLTTTEKTIVGAINGLKSSVDNLETKDTTIESEISDLKTKDTSLESSINALDTELDTKVSKSGDTMTGTLVAPIIQTGSAANNYFQSQKFRGEGNAATYYHAVDFGYSGHNQIDFYEYGGTYNFWRNTSPAATSDVSNRVASLQLGKLLERGNTLTYPGKSGTFALTSDIVTYENATTAKNGLMSSTDKAKLDTIEENANNYTLPQATSSALGGTKIGYTESGRYYAVKLNDSGQMYVYVPWTDTNTTYTFTPNNPTLAWGTTSTIGTIGGQTFKITMPSNPNTDTHYTTMAYIGVQNAKSNASTTNGSTYLKLYDDSTMRSQFLIKGSGATNVVSDTSGNVEIQTKVDDSTIKVGSNGLESHQVEISIDNTERHITLNIN